jgi:hypothetical protein
MRCISGSVMPAHPAKPQSVVNLTQCAISDIVRQLVQQDYRSHGGGAHRVRRASLGLLFAMLASATLSRIATVLSGALKQQPINSRTT